MRSPLFPIVLLIVLPAVSARGLGTAPGQPSEDEPTAALVNGGFEQPPTPDEPVPGWVIRPEMGAQALPRSTLEVSDSQRHSGRRSLHLRGDIGTRTWLSATQSLPVRPGANYRLSAWTHTMNVKREAAQLAGCSLTLTMFDAAGAVVGRRVILPERPRSRWMRQTTEVAAPPSVRSVTLRAFLSMTGDFWIDDVELNLDGGWELPAAEPVFEDRFDAEDLDPAWTIELEGSGRPARARVEPLPDGGAALRFSADEDTGQWVRLQRDVPAAAWDTLWLSGQVRVERTDDPLLPDLWLAIRFLDPVSEPLGEPVVVRLEQPEGSWRTLSTVAVAPAGSARARISVGLSSRGLVWVDDVLLQREPGARPVYAGWLRRQGRWVTVHLPPDHPETRHLKTLVRDLDRVVTNWRKAEQAAGRSPADQPEPIELWFHLDAESCRREAGGDPPLVDPATPSAHVLDERGARDVLPTLLGG